MKTEFNVSSDGAIIAVDHSLGKPGKLVLVGKVIKGTISKGDKIQIPARNQQDEPIHDEVERIEIFYEEVQAATEGNDIGICLKNTTKEQLIKHFGMHQPTRTSQLK